MISTEYAVSFRDFLDSMKGYRRIAKGAAFVYYLDCWLIPIFGLFLIAYPLSFYLRHDHDIWADLSWLTYLGAGFVILMPVIYRLQLYRAYRLRTSLTQGGRVSMNFDERNIRFLIPGKTEVKYEWRAFTGVAEGKQTYTLFAGKAAFHTIPRTALDAPQWETFMSMVKSSERG